MRIYALTHRVNFGPRLLDSLLHFRKLSGIEIRSSRLVESERDGEDVNIIVGFVGSEARYCR